MSIEYLHDRKITSAQFIDVLQRSTLAERRPVHDLERISDMLAHAKLVSTAWKVLNRSAADGEAA